MAAASACVEITLRWTREERRSRRVCTSVVDGCHPFVHSSYVQRNEIHFALSFDPQSYVFGDFSRSSKDQSVMEIQDGKLS